MSNIETEEISQDDRSIFLLNNILMSVQFFENYERDIKILRENWLKEVKLESHHKKCFHADSLFRLSGAKVKFSPRHGVNKISESPLHPFRIFVSSDNVEAAYDPSALGRNKLNISPQYQFTVKTNKNNEKSGYISLIEFKTIEQPNIIPRIETPQNNLIFKEGTETKSNYAYLQQKTVSEEKSNQRLSKTEKLIGFQIKELSSKMLEKSSLKNVTTAIDGLMAPCGFYKFQNQEARLKPKSIQEFRMHSSPNTSLEIPRECFQKEEIKKKLNSRRMELNGFFRSRIILNSAAFKGYFCDLLIARLSEALSLDFDNVNESSVLEEFIVVHQKRAQYCITPVISIKDWKNFVGINKKFRNTGKAKKLEWPTNEMQKIMKILPCNVVPIGHTHNSEENLEYEKTWKIVFPKAEEFLLLHMMHAHIRCYFFALLIYKSFIETEINGASFGPKHLMHLLFWRVQKNFLEWPDDRPGETLLIFLKVMYKKLQKKSLSDFFITSRNLFESSLSKDLHKAQALIKKIIENPVPYIIRAVRNLHFEGNFYPALDVLELNHVIITFNTPVKFKKIKKKKKQKIVRFQDEEQYWIKNAIKEIELERKAKEEGQTRKSIQSINIEEFFHFNLQNMENCNEILKMFTYHFMEMASKSIEFKFFSQALFYLHQTQKLFELIVSKGANQDYIELISERINKLREICYTKLKHDFKKFLPKEQYYEMLEKGVENSTNFKTKTTKEEKFKEIITKQQINEKEKQICEASDENMDNEILTIKL